MGNDLVTIIIQILAYITPFFLIPATFKFGLGVFGNLAGMINDRSRGVFDRQKKFRQGKRAEMYSKARAGDRYNNRGLNALTSRASTRNLGFGETGRAAYQQKIAGAGVDFAKSAEGQAVQHNDNALQAMTYGSEAEARAGLSRGDFGTKTLQDVNDSVAAAKAAGGFGRNRQVFAAGQLSRTGTGYDNIEQVARTIARASNGNSSQAAALAGDINASTKQAGRNDLAPGFGTLNSLAQAEMGATASRPTASDYHIATRDAWNSADIGTAVRNKGTGMEAFTSTFENVLSDASSTAIDKRDAAIAMAEMHASLPGASAGNQQYINDMLNQVLGPNWDNGTPIETQLSTYLSTQGVTASATEINQRARKYGNSVPPEAQGGSQEKES